MTTAVEAPLETIMDLFDLACENDECLSDHEERPAYLIMNWCGCDFLHCPPCADITLDQLRDMGGTVGLWHCAKCKLSRYGRIDDLVTVRPI